MQHSQPGRYPSPVRYTCQGLCVSPGVLWSIGGIRLWLEGVKVVEDGLEEGEIDGEFGEFGSDAVYDVGVGSTVGVDGVILLLW